MRVGLTGGIGSGKSAVARLFSGWGAEVIDADALARAVVAPGTSGFAAIADLWPQAITPDGRLDRAALSRVVFADASARDRLTAIVHPRVRAAAAAREAAAPPGALVVHDVPLLFEGDYWKSCAANIVVIAPVETRITRVMERDGVAAADVRARMAAQIDPEKARTMADFVIDNSGDIGALERQARAVFDVLQARSDA